MVDMTDSTTNSKQKERCWLGRTVLDNSEQTRKSTNCQQMVLAVHEGILMIRRITSLQVQVLLHAYFPQNP